MKMDAGQFKIDATTPATADLFELKAALADMARIARRAAKTYPDEQRAEALAILNSARASIDRINRIS